MNPFLNLVLALFFSQVIIFLFQYIILRNNKKNQQKMIKSELHEHFVDFQQQWLENMMKLDQQKQSHLQELLLKQMQDIRHQISQHMQQNNQSLSSHLQTMTKDTQQHLQTMSQFMQVKLNEGFEKTSATFHDVLKRLVMIDEAQKKISELSTHVVSLQDILVDKKARGAFGEIQLQTLLANMLPSQNYKIQHTLSNQKRADCMLFLPQPTGNIVIDAKFPLENYQRMMQFASSSPERKPFQQQFRLDIQKHIKDIAEKYIVPSETGEGALMFIPAEAIFAEIHSNYPELIELSHRLNVWLVSPSTLMAVLTTAKAVLKDDATRQQIHIIQKHLHALAQDFQRFDKRMEKLSRHLDQAHQDMTDVHVSAKKITQQFQKIESADLGHLAPQSRIVDSEKTNEENDAMINL
ncbi:MAG: DNA recombination protein RmuC [Gammaproteobacteria bacterium]|nr:DNA recombination protein RmuC [Gammaproteobacteria bacterium]